jgi:hypothetical protein
MTTNSKASTTASRSAAATVSPLPTSGGPSLGWPLTLMAALAMVGSGMAALALLRSGFS